MLLNNSQDLNIKVEYFLEEESALIKESRRIMEVCNACRYCGAFCAVFPAMEMRRSFSRGDLEYLANLCHNCTGCFHACQYAPPQEFDINNPKVMAELRAETYQKYAWPAPLAKMYRNNGRAISYISAFSVMIVLLFALFTQGNSTLFTAHSGSGSFYQVIPYGVMLGVPIVIAICSIVALLVGVFRFAKGTGWDMRQLAQPQNVLRAAWDVLALRYLGGSGDGCNYEDDTFNHKRRWFHQAIFYGFLLCLVSTTVALVYDHFLHLPAPYGFTSIPVLTGTLGGLAILIGTSGMLWLKMKRDKRPQAEGLLGMDTAFTSLLFLTTLSGLLLLLLRDTTTMGILLVIHLGFVSGFFITLPYSKFVHAVYRFAALVRFADEKRRNPDGDGII